MKDSLKQYVFDSTTAFTGGTATNMATGGNNQTLVLIVSLLTPLAHKLIFALGSFISAKIAQRKNR